MILSSPLWAAPTREMAVNKGWFQMVNIQIVMVDTGRKAESGRVIFKFDRVLGYQPPAQPAHNGEESIIRQQANTFIQTAIDNISYFDGDADAIKGALKHLGYSGISRDAEKRLGMYRSLKKYAACMERGMDAESAMLETMRVKM